MDHREAGQGTPFDSMPHEQMLAWLDKANSGAVQGASDRLRSAATEIRKIAEELKVRPQLVAWEGEGAEAFRTWSADLANATLRLGDYSDGASKWLAQASGAIASAQASMPRVPAGAQANLEAALGARNDPDAADIAKKATQTLDTHRQDAAAEMRRLAQLYAFSASQMDSLEKPAFPPPPTAFVPSAERAVGSEQSYVGSAGGGGGNDGVGTGSAGVPAFAAVGPTSSSRVGLPEGTVPVSEVPFSPSTPVPIQPVGMSIDSMAILPNAPTTPPAGPVELPVGGKADVGVAPPLRSVPPVTGGGRSGPPGQSVSGRTGGGIRPPVLPGQGTTGAGPAARVPRDGGTIGGRPVPQNSGRPTGGLPRGTVIGGEGAHGRGPMGRGMGTGGVGGVAAPNGTVGGRRLAGEAGGVVGGRPQQSARPSARPFTPGGSGLIRDGNTGAAARGAGATGRSAGRAPGSRAGRPRRDENGERPDYLIEDEETWQQGARRVVPPVID